MPELPEVETTRHGITPHISGKKVSRVIVRQDRLRWPVPANLGELLRRRTLYAVERRAKYLLLRFRHGTLIIHLGMSGSLRIIPCSAPVEKHDHLDIAFGTRCLRLRDPRRFGAVLWTTDPPETHELLRALGPEPLDDAFSAAHLYQQAQKRRVPIKNLIMDGKVVVGVGNIYANEALFAAGIDPRRAANRISRTRIAGLVTQIKRILQAAIEQGGTTLQDFQQADGRPGYFAQSLHVYGKGGEPCPKCGRPLGEVQLGQRNTVYCAHCQR